MESVVEVAWPIVVAMGIVCVFLLMRKGLVRKMGVSKDGGISLEMGAVDDRVDKRDGTKHFMDERISEIDDRLYADIKAKTRALRRPFMRAVDGNGLCSAARNALGFCLRDPLDQAVDYNNLKGKLSVTNRAGYYREKLGELYNEYTDMVEESKTEPCTAGPVAIITFHAWAEVEPKLLSILESWGKSIAELIIEACEAKISVYDEYRPQFETDKLEYLVKVCDDCIEKNRRYISWLQDKP